MLPKSASLGLQEAHTTSISSCSRNTTGDYLSWWLRSFFIISQSSSTHREFVDLSVRGLSVNVHVVALIFLSIVGGLLATTAMA